jgi:hypothetical protein
MRKIPCPGILMALFSPVLLAQSVDIPLRNWTVPPYTRAMGGLTTMTDVTPPRLFVGVAPCRIADTRSGQGFSGQAGPPALAANVTRNFQITGTVSGVPAQCGIPVGADAVSFQFSVGLPTSAGNFIAWPAGGAQPSTSVLNWDGPIGFLGNATIISVSAAGALSVRLNAAAGQSAHLILDVNGYFSDTLANPGNFLQLTNNSDFYTYFGWNQSPTCLGVCGVYMQTDSTAGNVAILGAAVGATGQNVGVEGFVLSTTEGSVGVHGISPATTGKRYGVLGEIDGSTNSIPDSAAVLGRDQLAPITQTYQAHPAGVRGESTFEFGVLGISNSYVAVGGILNDLLGNIQEEGRLASGNYGVYAFGDYGGTGMKFFLEPHPTDASKVIRYVALEGNEPGTYFRGRGRFRNGLATIDVPEDFRMVTDEDGLTVQVTPIGGMASVGVLRIGLDRIVVQSSRDLDFSYTVNGIRRTHKGVMSPIAENEFEYVPRSSDERIPAYLTEGQKELLIQNGTYNPDGTVNMETARRLGWDRKWAERAGRPVPAPTP